MSLLEIEDLSIEYTVSSNKTVMKAVNNVSLSIEKGETLGLVGETGAGKTTTALGIMNIVPHPPGRITNGRILYMGKNILDMNDTQLRHLRGNEISMIFQDPMTALNPVMRVGDQIAEVIRLHERCSHVQAVRKSLDILNMVGIPSERSVEYPHNFSGGMRQRVVIAMALACNPQLLIADEPTSALDVTIQAQVLESINELKQKMGTAVLMITHDLGIVAQLCDKVAIMYAGEIVEYGRIEHIFRNASHPYTKGLFDSLPNLEVDVDRLKPIPGLMPNPSSLPEGCHFHPRCPQSTEQCKCIHPGMTEIEPGHLVRCLRCQEGQTQ